jgi:hypothetical protein
MGLTYTANGAREVARRVRQIANGQLKVENGLLITVVAAPKKTARKSRAKVKTG